MTAKSLGEARSNRQRRMGGAKQDTVSNSNRTKTSYQPTIQSERQTVHQYNLPSSKSPVQEVVHMDDTDSFADLRLRASRPNKDAPYHRRSRRDHVREEEEKEEEADYEKHSPQRIGPGQGRSKHQFRRQQDTGAIQSEIFEFIGGIIYTSCSYISLIIRPILAIFITITLSVWLVMFLSSQLKSVVCKPTLLAVPLNLIGFCPMNSTVGYNEVPLSHHARLLSDLSKVETVNKQFNDIVVNVGQGGELGVSVGNSEASLNLLLRRLDRSELDCKEHLFHHLTKVLEYEDSLARMLHDLRAQVYVLHDRVALNNEKAMNTLERLKRKQRKDTSLLRLTMPILRLFTKDSEAVNLMEKIFESARSMNRRIQQMSQTAAYLEQALDEMKRHLDEIESLADDEEHLRRNQDPRRRPRGLKYWMERLSGENAKKMADFDQHGELLDNVLTFQKDAKIVVRQVREKLRDLESNLKQVIAIHDEQELAYLDGRLDDVSFELMTGVLQRVRQDSMKLEGGVVVQMIEAGEGK